MQFREAFSRSKNGEKEGITAMQSFAAMGAKEAESVLIEQVNKEWLKSPGATFQQMFDRVIAAEPLLHKAYLNGNNVNTN